METEIALVSSKLQLVDVAVRTTELQKLFLHRYGHYMCLDISAI